MKRIVGLGKKAILKADMFEAPTTLYINGESQVSRPCSGFVSLLLIGFFTYVFASGIVGLLQGERITAKKIYEFEQNFSSLSLSNLSIGISPNNELYEYWSTDFKVTTELYSYNGQKLSIKELQMQRCKLQKWNKYQPIYNQFKLGQNMCIKNSQEVQLKSILGDLNRSELHIRINPCDENNTENITCTSPQILQGYLNWYQYIKKSNYFTIFLQNTVINANKQDPIQQYIPINYQYYYNSLFRPKIKIQLGTYIIETDKSIWPLYQDIEKIQGYYISKVVQQDINKQYQKNFASPDLQYFGEIIFTMSPKRLRYVRKIGKIDQVLAYVGGLFGVFLVIFSFIFSSFNKYSYELLVAEYSFNYLESGEKIKTKKFGFFKYLKYQIYNSVNFVFGKRIPWADCKMIDETRDQANHFLDVQHLFKKMRLIQLMFKTFVKSQEEKIAYLIQHPSLFQVKQKRLFMQYYDKIIQSQQTVNIEDLKSNEHKVNRSICKLSSMPNILQTEGPMASNTSIKIDEDDKQNQFKSKIKQYLFIQDPETIQFVSKHKKLYESAKDIKISKSMQQIQAQPTLRNLVLQKIPLKILFRLFRCIRKLCKKQQKYNNLVLQNRILKKMNSLQSGMSNQIISQQSQKNLIQTQQQSGRQVEQQCKLI